MTSLLAPSGYLDAIRGESARFRAVLAACPPEARVPSCPDWSADDLLWHLGEVQHFWARIVRERPTPPDAFEEPRRPGTYAGLLDFFDESHGRLVGALEAADPAEEAWSWSVSADHHRISWVLRRQAHEALIHRLDAELAADLVTPLESTLAADGVDEVLDVMYGGKPPWGVFTPDRQYVEFRMRDVKQSVWVQLGCFTGTAPDGTEIADEPDFAVVAPEDVRLESGAEEADVVVIGTAAALDAWLWRRAGDDGVEPVGDRDVYTRIRTVLQQPIE